jgi:pectate lyase
MKSQICRIVFVVLMPLGFGLFAPLHAQSPEMDYNYIELVRQFADNVLENGRDTYGDVHSPLFVDGINTRTGEPVKWELDGSSWILSNFASQQNLLRVLVGLSEITGDSRYRDAAAEATQYMFDHHADEQGLLYWGGHQFVDLQTMQNQFEGRPHELKNNFPFYEFMWEVDPDATRRMLRAMWNAHILDWTVLDMNRHAEFNTEMGRLWDHEFEQQPPFFEARGLTFINFGTDMMHIAFSLYFLGEEQGAREWGLRLFEQYVRARHPKTGLGAYQYSKPLRRDQPPSEGPLTGTLTFSGYGDRAENQFGAVYGDIALEGNALWGSRLTSLYGRNPIIILYVYEQLKDPEARAFLLNNTLAGMKAAAKYAYDTERNVFKPLWTDGTDLTGQTMQRTGYFGEEGDEFEAHHPDGTMALAFARAVRLNPEDSELWGVLRNMFIGEKLGDPGDSPVGQPQLNMHTKEKDPDYLFALLDLYKISEKAEFLALADKIGRNIVDAYFHDGYFKPGKEYLFSRFDNAESLALLTLEAYKRGIPDAVPVYLSSVGSTQGEHDGHSGSIRDFLFYEATEDSADN